MDYNDHPLKFIVKGIFVDTLKFEELRIRNGFILVENGIIKTFSENNPDESLPIYDFSNKLIIPGLVDLHLHASQYSFCGTGMDLELLDWLNTYTFKEESRFKDINYAKKYYQLFSNDLEKSGTTRAVIFATIHADSTLILMDILEKKKIIAYVGKVEMDRNSPDYYIEKMEKKKQQILLKNV